LDEEPVSQPLVQHSTFTPHGMGPGEFQKFVADLTDEESDEVLMFVNYVVLAINYPNTTLNQLRGFVHQVFTTRPNKIWDDYQKYMEDGK
jgi:hypothetical protein